MFVVTNREIFPDREGFKKFGKRPAAGADTLRLVEATGGPGSWNLTVLEDIADEAMREEAGLDEQAISAMRMKAGLEPQRDLYASDYVAAMLLKKLRARGGPRDLLFFVHGFNNDVESVLDRAHRLQTRYNVEVVPFSWPANGGGAWGVVSYKSDKRDALNSTGGLDRCIDRIGQFIQQFNAEGRERILQDARARFRGDGGEILNKEAEDAYVAQKMADHCPIKVSMLLHSMGNYLFKKLLESDSYHARDLIFENVVLAAADTNNEGHRAWIDKIRCRNRIYITINEDDSALRVSRMKAGELQRARLGHYTYGLDASQAVYVNFTDARFVGDSHAYFEGNAVRNSEIKAFFKAALTGKSAENDLDYNAAKNLYTFK